jgi:putative acetyltransferase
MRRRSASSLSPRLKISRIATTGNIISSTSCAKIARSRFSLVAVRDAAVVGHFAPVTIDGKLCAWYGLGPLSVAPFHQRKGVGSGLVQAGLKLLEAGGANVCVVLGEADFYSRFGFVVRDAVQPPRFPAKYFLALPFLSDYPRGNVTYDDAFTT